MAYYPKIIKKQAGTDGNKKNRFQKSFTCGVADVFN